MKIPFLYCRKRKCTAENGLIPNDESGHNVIYVVMLSEPDFVHYDSGWMHDPLLGDSEDEDDLVSVPDVDVVTDPDIWVFDGPNAGLEYVKALLKIQTFWAEFKPF